MSCHELCRMVARWLTFIMNDTIESELEMVATTLGIEPDVLLKVGKSIINAGCMTLCEGEKAK